MIIIAISTFITLVTALSTSALTTNGEIGGGGTYYVMSRILGPEWGGSIGILFALANAINSSLNVVGFCETIQDAMKNYGGYFIVDGGDNDIRILGVVLMVLVWVLCGLGAKYEMMVSPSSDQIFRHFNSLSSVPAGPFAHLGRRPGQFPHRQFYWTHDG